MTEWHQDHRNVVDLCAYMAEVGFSASDVAYAVEKPWKFEDEFKAMRQAEIDEARERARARHPFTLHKGDR